MTKLSKDLIFAKSYNEEILEILLPTNSILRLFKEVKVLNS